MPYVNLEKTGLNLKSLMKSKNLTVKDLQKVFGLPIHRQSITGCQVKLCRQ